MDRSDSQSYNNQNTGSLTLTGSQKKTLSKEQQAFNRNIKKIESLRLDIIQRRIFLDEMLDYFMLHVHPNQIKLAALNKQLVVLLFDFFKRKNFLTKKQKEDTKELIASLLDDIFSVEDNEPSEDLKRIFKAVNGESYEDSEKNNFEMLNDMFKKTFSTMGVKMTMNGFHEHMTQEEMMQKLAQLGDDLQKSRQQKQDRLAQKKKSKKQLEKEEKAQRVEEAKAKNIRTIYKQLAKILHPDLEQDSALKLQKEELMKQLTIAYENKDLHTLLSLELTWIQKEENNLDKLSTEKLNIYNEVLKEQIKELESELVAVAMKERYQPLNPVDGLYEIGLKEIDHEKEFVNLKIEEASLEIKKMMEGEKQALAVIKSMLQSFKEFKKLLEEEDEDFMFGKMFDDSY